MLSFQPMQANHWPEVKAIYLQGIATGLATFQQQAPGWEEWNKGHLEHSRLVAVTNNTVVGWAALSPVSLRYVYRGVAEVSVYIAEEQRGNGLGRELLRQLILQSEKNGIWTLQSSIFPENKASLSIHEKNGFRLLGKREKIGQLNGSWRDTVILERRSKTVGI